MWRQAGQRLLLAVPVLVGVLLIGFLLMQVVPTDPAAVRAGPMATADVGWVAAIRTELGLDQPIPIQFARYLLRLMHGDLGVSIINNEPVVVELGNTVGPTVELMVASLVWAVPLGIACSARSPPWSVAAGRIGLVMALGVAGVSVPVFFVGLVLIWFVGFKWQLLPFTGRAGPLWTLEGLQSVALPAITLGAVFVGPVARMTRSSVLDMLRTDHVRTARAKGLTERAVVDAPRLAQRLDPRGHADRAADRLLCSAVPW